MEGSRRFLCVDDFERTARRFLPRMPHGYVAGGVETGASLAGHSSVPQVLVAGGHGVSWFAAEGCNGVPALQGPATRGA